MWIERISDDRINVRFYMVNLGGSEFRESDFVGWFCFKSICEFWFLEWEFWMVNDIDNDGDDEYDYWVGVRKRWYIVLIKL